MNRVVHFEIHAAEPERAAKFYRELFGWEISEWTLPGVQISGENRYWLVTTGPDSERGGITGGILVRRGPEPSAGQPVNGFVCVIQVDSVDELVEKAIDAGATIALPKMAIKGVGWVAYCHDTEGNIFGMMQNDQNAP